MIHARITNKELNMKIMIAFLLTLLTLNSFAETPSTQNSNTNSQVTIEDSASTATPEPVATPVSLEEESSPAIPTSEEVPSEETTDTSSSDDEEW